MEIFKKIQEMAFEYNLEEVCINEEAYLNNVENVIQRTNYFRGLYANGEIIYYYIGKILGLEESSRNVAYEKPTAKKIIEENFGEGCQKIRELVFEKCENLLDDEYVFEKYKDEQMLEKVCRSETSVAVVSDDVLELYVKSVVGIIEEAMFSMLIALTKKEIVFNIDKRLLALFMELDKVVPSSMLDKRGEMHFQIRKMICREDVIEKRRIENEWKKGDIPILRIISNKNKSVSMENLTYWFSKMGVELVKNEEINDVLAEINTVLEVYKNELKNGLESGEKMNWTNYDNEKIYELKKAYETLMERLK